MDQTASMNGRYYRTCMNDIRSSEGWFGKVCLLGLISFIPIFGQMTVSGYAYEWAHKAAWGLQDPMPKKIYGRPGSKMLRWGWFVIVITFVFALIPGIISIIGNVMNATGSPDIVYTSRGVRSVGTSNPALIAAGGLLSFVGIIFAIFVGILAWVGCIRMTIYDRLGTGLQLGKIWRMAKHDFGGLMRIFGMSLIWGIIFGIIFSIICMIVVMIAVVPSIAVGAYGSSSGGNAAMATYVLAAIAVATPILLVIAYAACVAQAFLSILIARAVGYWARQFNLASWGTPDDPLPFEAQGAQQAAQYAMPQQPYQQSYQEQPYAQESYAQEQAFTQQPAQPQEGAYVQAQPTQPVAEQPMPVQPVEQAMAEQLEPAQPAQTATVQPEVQPTQAAAVQPETQPAVEQPQQAQPAEQVQPQQAVKQVQSQQEATVQSEVQPQQAAAVQSEVQPTQTAE